jgi:hypothetical protein
MQFWSGTADLTCSMSFFRVRRKVICGKSLKKHKELQPEHCNFTKIPILLLPYVSDAIKCSAVTLNHIYFISYIYIYIILYSWFLISFYIHIYFLQLEKQWKLTTLISGFPKN